MSVSLCFLCVHTLSHVAFYIVFVSLPLDVFLVFLMVLFQHDIFLMLKEILEMF